MQLRSTKVELQEAGVDTEGLAESTSKLREQVLALTNVTGEGGFDIFNVDTNSYKAPMEILSGIAEVYDRMSDLDQAALLELIAGKRNSNTVAAILQNWDTVEKAYQTALNAEGSAERENQRYVESIQGQLNILQNKWNELWTTSTNQDAILSLVKLGQTAIDVADDIGLVQLALASLSGGWFLKNLGRLDVRVA